MITRSPIYNVARSLTSSQYEFIEREFGYSKTSFLDLPDETLVDIYYDLCDIEATALLCCAMMVVLGRLGDRPFLLYDTDPEVVLCAAGFMFPRTAKSPCSVKS